MAFYRQIADEINQACDDGRLPARSRRSGFAPVLQEGEAGQVMRTFFSFCDFVISYRSFGVITPISIGDNNDLELFRDLTRDRLSASERATIFDRYKQGNRGRAVGGSGLGLAIARGIAEAHHGRITVGEGDLGGASFRLTVPA